MNAQDEQFFTDQDDREAVLSVQAGDTQAFSLLVERYTPALYALALRMLGDRETASEAVQEVFFKAYRHLSTFEPQRRFYPWLYTIAVNYVRTELRKIRFRERFHHRSADPDYTLSFIPSRHAAPEESLLRREADREISVALRTVPPRQREVFVLRYVSGLSVRDVSEIVKLPENTVKTYAKRAREKLAHALSSVM